MKHWHNEALAPAAVGICAAAAPDMGDSDREPLADACSLSLADLSSPAKSANPDCRFGDSAPRGDSGAFRLRGEHGMLPPLLRAANTIHCHTRGARVRSVSVSTPSHIAQACVAGGRPIYVIT